MNYYFMRTALLAIFSVSSLLVSAQQFQWDKDKTSAKTPAQTQTHIDETGFAVFYADYFEGNPTALGEVYRANLMTAAHRKLPLGTIVKVTRIDNGLSTTVRINDRGAYCEGCIVDLSKAAAKQIDLIRAGRSKVYLTVIGYSNENPSTPSQFVSPAPQNQLVARGANNNTRNQYTNTTVDQAPAQAFGVPQIQPHQHQVQTTTRKSVADMPQGSPQNAPLYHTTAKGGNNTTTTKGIASVSTPKQGYAIQLGSYGQFENAERHVANLQDKGFNHLFVIQDNKADGSTVNRVMVAPFASLTEAQSYLNDLRQYHSMDGIVVQMK